jgi:pimeloyl-ACP methyl ester carboxylesterase
MRGRRAALSAAVLRLAVCARADRAGSDTWVDISPHRAGTVRVDGVRLAHLDWGGEGQGLLLHHGLGDSPHCFDGLAPSLTDRFHVVGRARRAHGLSERRGPYDMDTLVEDIRQFLDGLGRRQVVLVGHSMAGSEMVRFVALHPERVSALVFLDATYDFDGAAFTEAMEHYPLAVASGPEERASLAAFRGWFKASAWPDLPRSPAMEAEIRDVALPRAGGGVDYVMDDTVIAGAYFRSLQGYRKEYQKVRAAALAIVAETYAGAVLPADAPDSLRRKVETFLRTYAVPLARSSLVRFRAEVRGGRVIVMPESNPYVYLHHPAEVGAAIRDFLLGAGGESPVDAGAPRGVAR